LEVLTPEEEQDFRRRTTSAKEVTMEIRKWVERNTTLMPDAKFTPDELDHIAMCMEHIHKWYYENYPLGDFLTAVVRNDFRQACTKADDVNRKALYLYALFVFNQIPGDYIKRK